MDNEQYYNELRKKFVRACNNYVVTTLSKYENDRIHILSFCKKFIIFSYIVCIIIFLFTFFFPILILAIAIHVLFKGLVKKKFELNVKEKIMQPICEAIGDITWSDKPINFDELMLQDSNFFGDADDIRISYDDVFSGRYKNINFNILESYAFGIHAGLFASAEVCICNVPVSEIKSLAKGFGKNKSSFVPGVFNSLVAHFLGDPNYEPTVMTKEHEDLFQGLIIAIDMNKKFTSNTIISGKSSKCNYNSVPTLHETKLEDVKFQSNYKVYTNDEVEARYILTPTFMEKINGLVNKFKAQDLSCAFYENKIIIGLNDLPDLFSLCSLDSTLLDSKPLMDLFEQVLSIYKLIDYLELDKNIGL